MGQTVTATFTAAANGNAFAVLPDDSLTYTVTGTYTGAMIFERSRNNGATWTPVVSGTSGQVFSGSVENTSGMTERYRWRSTVATGTASTTIADVDKVVQRFVNRDNVPRIEITDDGVNLYGTVLVDGQPIGTGGGSAFGGAPAGTYAIVDTLGAVDATDGSAGNPLTRTYAVEVGGVYSTVVDTYTYGTGSEINGEPTAVVRSSVETAQTFAVSSASSGLTGAAVTVTFDPAGSGAWPAGTVLTPTITGASGLAGTFAPTSRTLGVGVTASQTFDFTPTGAGTGNLTAIAVPGITASAVQAFTATAVTFVLDSYTGAAFAYSPRKLRSAQTFCMRVRASSGSFNTGIYDVAADTAGVSASTALTYVSGASGATTISALLGGSANVQIVTWYDQSGNGRDITQPNTTLQPDFARSGVLIPLDIGKPNAIGGNAAANKFLSRDSIAATDLLTSGNQGTTFFVSNVLANSASQSLFSIAAASASLTNNYAYGKFGTSSNADFDAPETGGRTTETAAPLGAQQHSMWRNGADAVIRRGGAAVTTVAGRTGALSGTVNINVFLGNQFNNFFYFNGQIGELIHYPTKIADASIIAVDAEQKEYWGTP